MGYRKDPLREGRPIILHVTSGGNEAGPKNDPRTWRIARWTGAAWQEHDVLVSDNNYDTGSVYIESETLRGRIQREKQLSLDDALQITREVAEGMVSPAIPRTSSGWLGVAVTYAGGTLDSSRTEPQISMHRMYLLQWRRQPEPD